MDSTYADYQNPQRQFFQASLATEFVGNGVFSPVEKIGAEFCRPEFSHNQVLPEINGNDWSYPQSSTIGARTVPVEIPYSFVISVSWVARVYEVSSQDGKFTAILSSKGNPDEIAELDVDDVSPDDQELIAPGAIFYWSIGQTQDSSGRKMNASAIRFQRIRHWKRGDIEKARSRAEKFERWL